MEIGKVCEQLSKTVDPSITPDDCFTEYSMPAYDNEQSAAVVKGTEMNSIRKVLDKPCVLVNKLNVRKKRVWLVSEPEQNAVASAEFVPLASQSLNLNFLLYSSLTDRFTNYMLNCSSGSSNSQKRVTPDVIMNYVLEAPSYGEQKRIGDFLSLLDKRISEQALLLKHLKKYKRGLLTYAFEEMTVSVDADSTAYLFSEIAQRRKEKYSPDFGIEYPCVELEHIEQGTGRLLGSVSSTTQNSIKTVAKKGDVLFGKLRPYLKKFAFVEQDMVCSSEIWALIPSQYVIPKYLYYLVQTEHFLRVANISSGTKMPRAEWANIEKEPFDIPFIPMQEKIVSILEAIDKKIGISGNSLRMLVSFKEGLLQQLFI